MKTSKPAAVIPAEIVTQANALGVINGSRPVVGWLSVSPRRGAYAIRFFPCGTAAGVQDLGQGVVFTPAVDPFVDAAA